MRYFFLAIIMTLIGMSSAHAHVCTDDGGHGQGGGQGHQSHGQGHGHGHCLDELSINQTQELYFGTLDAGSGGTVNSNCITFNFRCS